VKILLEIRWPDVAQRPTREKEMGREIDEVVKIYDLEKPSTLCTHDL
jgi:hypothetical protein